MPDKRDDRRGLEIFTVLSLSYVSPARLTWDKFSIHRHSNGAGCRVRGAAWDRQPFSQEADSNADFLP
jgi:hypothetical protein